MRESLQVLEWIEQGRSEGKIETKVEAVLRLLQKKFPPGAPDDLKAAIRTAGSVELLDHWFDAAIDAASLDDFRRALGS